MSEYKLTFLWVAIAILVVVIVVKLIKKAVVAITVLAILIGLGCIPVSSVQSAVNLANGTYTEIRKEAALWSIETTYNDKKETILYLLNTIPITLSSDEIEEDIVK